MILASPEPALGADDGVMEEEDAAFIGTDRAAVSVLIKLAMLAGFCGGIIGGR